jgi:hypothetical protein
MLLALGGGSLGLLFSYWLAKFLVVLLDPGPGSNCTSTIE